MDKEDSSVRRHLSDGSVLLGGLRLPNTVFKANAGTDVTTDILFLQKRSRETPEVSESWIDLKSMETADGRVEINEYFARHPEMMLGRMGMESGQYGMAPALVGSLEPGALERAISLLPATVCKNRDSQAHVFGAGPDQVPAVGEVKEGGLAERDGQLVVRRGNTFEPVTLPVSARQGFTECSRCATPSARCSAPSLPRNGRSHHRSSPPSKQHVRFLHFSLWTPQRAGKCESVCG